MPCTYYESPEELHRQKLETDQKRIDEMYKSIEDRFTALLCGACTALERLKYNFAESPDLDTWWYRHKEYDEAIKLQELEHRAKQAKLNLELEKAVLIAETKSIKDLTKEERKLLKQHKLL